MALNVGTLQATLGLDSKPFEDGAEQAVEKGGASLGAFGRLAETAGVQGAGMFSNGLSGLKGDLEEIGLSGGQLLVGGIAVAAGALAAVAAHLGEMFHEAFATIENDTGATGEKLDQLKAGFKDLFGSLPNDASDIASTMATLQARLGGTAQQTTAISEQVLKLTDAMGGDLPSNVQGVADLFTRWNVPTSQQSLLLDQLTVAAQKSGVPVSQLIQQAADGAPDFQMLNYTVQQAVATIASMGKEGANATDFLTGLQHGIVNVATMNQAAAQQQAAAAKQAVSDAQAERERIDAIASAWQGVQKANEQVAAAQKAYDTLLSGGIERAATDGRNQMADATASVTDAQAALIKSKQDLDDLLAGPSESDEAKARLKLSQATAAVTASMTQQAKAQNDLSDAQARGVNGTDLAQLQDALTSATNGVTQAQLDQADAQQALADMQSGSPAQQAAIAAAQQAAAEAANKLSDAQASQADTTANLQSQLGPQLDGSAMLVSAQQSLTDAHNGVAQALEGVQQAGEKQTTQSTEAAIATDAAGGSFSTTQKILAQLGDTNADSTKQLQDLTSWMFTTKDRTDQLGVATELFGKRSAVQFVTAINDGSLSLKDLQAAMGDASGATDAAYDNMVDANTNLTLALHQLEAELQPLASSFAEWLTDTTQRLDGFGNDWDTCVARFHDGSNRIQGWLGQMADFMAAPWVALDHAFNFVWNGVMDFVAAIPARVERSVSGMWDFAVQEVIGAANWITGIWNNVVDWTSNIPGRIGDALGGLFDYITAPFKTAFNFIAQIWNSTVGGVSFTIPTWVPLVGGDSFGFPKMPKFHSGGVVPGIPGSDVPAMLQAGETVRTRAQEAALGGGVSLAAPPVILHQTVNINGPVAGHETARFFAAEITRATKMALPMHIRPSAVHE